MFSYVERFAWDNEDLAQELRKIFLEAGALDYDKNIIYRQQKKGQVSKLLINLTSNQRRS